MIREATAADLPRVARILAERSGLSPEGAAALAGGGVCLLSEGGVICGSLVRSAAYPGRVIATETAWAPERGAAPDQLRAFSDWARRVGADEVRAASTEGWARQQAVARLMRREGFAPMAVIYRRSFDGH